MRARTSARVCALPGGKTLKKVEGKWTTASPLRKKHCGKFVETIDIGRRGNTYVVIAVRGQQIAVTLKHSRSEAADIANTRWHKFKRAENMAIAAEIKKANERK